MKLTLNDLTLIMSFDNKNEEKLIKKFITFKDESKAFCNGSFHRERVKDVCFGKDIKGYFVCFAGFTKEILLYCKEAGINISEIKDNRTHYAFQKKEYTHDELRSYFNPNFKYVEHQIRILKAMAKTNTAIVVAPTSAGKSSAISAYIRLAKLPALILVNKVMLGEQIRDGLIKDGIDCGICSGRGVIEGESMVSTIQSVFKIGDLTRFKICICDETQNLSANTYQDFFKQFGCPIKFGFSATPMRSGDYFGYAKIRQFVGSPCIEIKSDELLENGVMAKPHIYMVKNECSNEYIDYATAYSYGVVNNDRRNQKIVNICDKYKKGILIVVNIVEHGELLESKIPGAKFISGETPIEERRKYIDMFDKGELPVLIGSTILQEGISITHMKAMILACGGKSNVAVLQKIGRSLRFKEGEKTEVDYYDFVDLGCSWLLKHSKTRISLYKKAGYNDIKILDEDLQELKN